MLSPSSNMPGGTWAMIYTWNSANMVTNTPYPIVGNLSTSLKVALLPTPTKCTVTVLTTEFQGTYLYALLASAEQHVSVMNRPTSERWSLCFCQPAYKNTMICLLIVWPIINYWHDCFTFLKKWESSKVHVFHLLKENVCRKDNWIHAPYVYDRYTWQKLASCHTSKHENLAKILCDCIFGHNFDILSIYSVDLYYLTTSGSFH